MSEPEADVLEVGRIDKAHGLRGEVIVTLSTDRLERLDEGSTLVTDAGRALVVEFSAKHQHRWRVGFAGLGSREDADALRGSVLYAAPLPDPDGGLWVHELIGSEVRLVDGTVAGTCTSVVANPAHELLELDSGALVPVVFVTEHTEGIVTIDPPDGLFDL